MPQDEEHRAEDPKHPGPSRVQLTAVAVVIIVYAALSQYSTEAPGAKGLAATLSLAPVLIVAGLLLWRWTGPWICAGVALGTGVVLYRYWPWMERHYEWADLTEQCGIYGLVAASFGRSLYGGRVPLCTQIAAGLHGALGPCELEYTRSATLAWGAFYALLAAAILVLYVVAPLRVWSLFVNFATFGLIAVMAVADHLIRRRVLPPRHTAGILTALRQALIG